MLSIINRYFHWLHGQWPAGTVEKLPAIGEGGTTVIPGVRIVGDLTGIPLLKFSSNTGALAVQDILQEQDFKKADDLEMLDLAIVGAGVSGMAAAMEAKKAGLNFKIFEASQVFSTIENFPKGKPIYTYPTEMTPAGDLQFSTAVKEDLLEELEAYREKAGITVTEAHIHRIERKSGILLLHRSKEDEPVKAQRVIIGIGRSGNHRKLGVPGEDLDKVYNRLYDPREFCGKDVLIVGGGDSALETAIALVTCGAHVTFSYRGKEFTRPKPENIEKIELLEKDSTARVGVVNPHSDRVTTAIHADHSGYHDPGSLTVAFGTQIKEIRDRDVVLITKETKEEKIIKNDTVFSMLGREAPLDFFRRSKIAITGEWSKASWTRFLLFFAFCIFLYNWKAGGSLNQYFQQNELFPYNVPGVLQHSGKWIESQASDPTSFIGTMNITFTEPGFYYSFAYCFCVILFGLKRIKRRKTPYIKRQTLTLMTIQFIPLFLLPYIILPFVGHNGFFDAGFGKIFADNLFPEAGYGHGREYWRSFGFILAWPLFIWNFFTPQPMTWWLVIGCIQTFVIIPLIIWRWGKGAYCGWICSCGALAETLGDTHRQKMPHGPLWNKLNMIGQTALAVAFILFFARIISWTWPNTSFGSGIGKFYTALLSQWTVIGIKLNYYYVVDIFLAGIVGVGCYFWFSGRVWCRFACPLAALMHIYARFTRFRIFSEKKKCISCNVCTSVCHQGIDIMNFANKGMPMEDPECVRCSACVQSCPTGVLTFGRYDGDGNIIPDRIKASPVHMAESVH